MASLAEPLTALCEVAWADALLPLLESTTVARAQLQRIGERASAIVTEIAVNHVHHALCESHLKCILKVLTELYETLRQCQPEYMIAYHLSNPEYTPAIKQRLHAELEAKLDQITWRLSVETLEMLLDIREAAIEAAMERDTRAEPKRSLSQKRNRAPHVERSDHPSASGAVYRPGSPMVQSTVAAPTADPTTEATEVDGNYQLSDQLVVDDQLSDQLGDQMDGRGAGKRVSLRPPPAALVLVLNIAMQRADAQARAASELDEFRQALLRARRAGKKMREQSLAVRKAREVDATAQPTTAPEAAMADDVDRGEGAEQPTIVAKAEETATATARALAACASVDEAQLQPAAPRHAGKLAWSGLAHAARAAPAFGCVPKTARGMHGFAATPSRKALVAKVMEVDHSADWAAFRKAHSATPARWLEQREPGLVNHVEQREPALRETCAQTSCDSTRPASSVPPRPASSRGPRRKAPRPTRPLSARAKAWDPFDGRAAEQLRMVLTSDTLGELETLLPVLERRNVVAHRNLKTAEAQLDRDQLWWVPRPQLTTPARRASPRLVVRSHVSPWSSLGPRLGEEKSLELSQRKPTNGWIPQDRTLDR